MRIFEIVKENVNLREAAELYGIDVNRYGKALCSFHNDRHPSLYVADDHYYCFACGEHGDVIDFVGRLFQLSPYDAARKLMADFHLSPDKPPSAAALHAKRIRTEAQLLMENERLCFSVLSDYARVLREWKVRYAPQSPDAPVHSRFVKACHKLDETEYYTKTILEDLCGEGALEFLTRVQSREYDESRAVLATYLYPHLKGRMTRWLEQHIGNLSLSKHEMDAVRQAQRLYHSGQFSIEEIAEKMDVLLEQAVKHIRYNTHFVGVNDLIPGSYDGDPFERLMPGNLSVSAEQVVYRKVCIELLQELFDALPKKDRDILGKFYGVFGFEKTSLKEIGMYHMMKESAVEKAKERAVTKLKKAYPGSRLQIWRNVHRMIRRPILPAKDDRALRRSFTTSTLRNQESGRS